MKKSLCFILVISAVLFSACGNPSTGIPEVPPSSMPAETAVPSSAFVPDISPAEGTKSAEELPPVPKEKALDACADPDTNLLISEIKASDYGINYDPDYSEPDWIEIRNAGAESVSLKGLFLSDTKKDLAKFPLSGTLSPGTVYQIFPDFGISAGDETIFLTDGETVLDWISWTRFPYYCTIGRMEGDTLPCYFEESTPGYRNRDGKHILSATPELSGNDGVFENTDSVEVSLSASGDIYYTLDGSLPTMKSHHYSEPFTVDHTCVVRAVAVEEDGIRSYPLSLTYIINEGFSLPVLSMVTDSPSRIQFIRNYVFTDVNKEFETPGNITLYDGGRCFSANCGVKLAGQGSLLEVAKISYDVFFRNSYCEEDFSFDVFDSGFSDYSSLNLHAGQDSINRMFNAEIWQDLCREMTDSVYTQHGKFCILYINGLYNGIYAIKENINDANLASFYGVKKSELQICKSFHEKGCGFCSEVIDFIRENDVTDPVNLEHIASIMDLSSYIDWLIMEGASGNSDLFSNVKIFKAGDDKWRFAFFDLDHAMFYPDDSWDTFFNLKQYEVHSNEMTSELFQAMMKSDVFLDAFLTRYSQVYNTYLSNERVLEKTDTYESILKHDAVRDREFWHLGYDKWLSDVQTIRDTVEIYDWQNHCVDKLFENSGLPETTKEHYFQ